MARARAEPSTSGRQPDGERAERAAPDMGHEALAEPHEVPLSVRWEFAELREATESFRAIRGRQDFGQQIRS